MNPLFLFICVIPTLAISITISSNGNSPEIKMARGMEVDLQKDFLPITQKPEVTIAKKNNEKNRKLNVNSTKLSINERYRRLIPYMTFYYANDLVTPTTETYSTKNIEVEKAQIVEASSLEHVNQRQPKKIVHSTYRNVPRYQGNRLTQYNIASANPTKIYKEIAPTYQTKVAPNYNPLLQEQNFLVNHDFERLIHKQVVKTPSAPFILPTTKPYIDIYRNSPNVQYYLAEKEEAPKYKLVPYEQTPPVRIAPQYEAPKKLLPVPVLIRKEQKYVKPRPLQSQYYYDNGNIEQVTSRKPPVTISESYFEKRRPEIIEPVIEGGFRPMIPNHTTEIPVTPSSSHSIENNKHSTVQFIENESVDPNVNENYTPENYYQYVVEKPAYKPPQDVPSNIVTLGSLLNTLQINKSIPKPITRDNVGSSIRTLLQVLNALKALPPQNTADIPVLSSPKPFVASKVVPVEVTSKPIVKVAVDPVVNEPEFHEEPYLAPINTPSQYLDDFSSNGGSTQQFPLPITSDDEGGTPGRPGADYPILTIIPQTKFDCKTQRYKGFFADPETRCQVWHYCDLNGGQASFLCPNGTIFSQAALTCDWWFNVRCASTTQLYVLNESLYKYILPHSPKFPEDYSGPLVDKYLSLKFKEMEEQFKKNKHKTASDKIDSDEESSEEETDGETTKEVDSSKTDVSSVSEASVVVQSPGTSGNVQRLQD